MAAGKDCALCAGRTDASALTDALWRAVRVLEDEASRLRWVQERRGETIKTELIDQTSWSANEIRSFLRESDCLREAPVRAEPPEK